MKQRVMTCIHCKKEYDLENASRKAQRTIDKKYIVHIVRVS
jgi:hypothetical protein